MGLHHTLAIALRLEPFSSPAKKELLLKARPTVPRLPRLLRLQCLYQRAAASDTVESHAEAKDGTKKILTQIHTTHGVSIANPEVASGQKQPIRYQ